MIAEPIAGVLIREDDEGLFSRDVDGQLVRLDSPTESDFEKQVVLQIDGQTVTVPLARPLKDANGNIVQDLEGRPTPRFTTIYDAAAELYVQHPGDEAKIPIPTLCHLPHMTPVAVCRLCVVQIYGQKRGKRAAERRLLPACQHHVKEGMEVFTMNDPGKDGARVRSTVKVMTEMLAANHLKPVENDELDRELSAFNELGQMAHRCEADVARYKLDVFSTPPPAAPPLAGRRKWDASSPVFLVDHTACILCERCVRGCDEVQENHVIGRTGKGATAGIGFDLNDPMGGSSCVQCGECMVSCPTSAITFKPVARIAHRRASEEVSAAELFSDPVFSGIPSKFLLWQKGLVLRRRLAKGDVLCRQGEAGNTAFILKSGEYDVTVRPIGVDGQPTGLGFFGLGAGRPLLEKRLTPADLIVGEMACLSGTPRNATVVTAVPGEVWEVRRNVLDRLMRLPNLRERFEAQYRERSLDLVFQDADLFKDVPDAEYVEIIKFLEQRLAFVSVRPGQVVFAQGDPVSDMYIVRLGHVRVGVRRYGNEAKVTSSGPGTFLGEIGLLGFDREDAQKTAAEVDRELKERLDRANNDPAAFPAGIRMATCSALGQLELARLRRADFLRMLREFPTLRRRVVDQSLARLRAEVGGHRLLDEYVEKGLYEGRSILTLNMDLCTRCDECTKGCVEQHGSESHGLPLTRMLRDGLRFGNYLVAMACRSCVDPHCMSGCPVDAIHRGRHLQIVIEDHCIGCGLCASNCPYGNIFMAPNEKRRIKVHDLNHPGETLMVAQPKAVTCDLCDAEGKRTVPKPRCVAACPHEAAERMTGDDLLNRVLGHALKKN